ncbi:MAG TPA: GDSL-type esterase/lipase family protein [Sphingobacteriaceae bacterium]
MNRKYLIISCLLLWVLPAAAQLTNKWEPSIRLFEKQDAAQKPGEGAILFVGSSSIAKWTDIHAYFPNYRVLNRGFGGSEFSDLLHYADRVILPYKPSKIFIYEGDNDVASGKSPALIFAQAVKLREIIRKALPGVPVVFISVKPSIARWHLKADFEAVNEKLKRYARRKSLTMYADVWTPMLDGSGKVLPVFLADDLHMTAAGYKIWQKALSPYMPPAKKD